jgi:hypothetical protein
MPMIAQCGNDKVHIAELRHDTNYTAACCVSCRYRTLQQHCGASSQRYNDVRYCCHKQTVIALLAGLCTLSWCVQSSEVT